MYLIAILLSSSFVYFGSRTKKQINVAMAGNKNYGLNDDVFGFAWSSNYGWTSFNSTDCDTNGTIFLGTPAGCPPDGTPFYDYGVNVNSNGDFLRSDSSHSYAWNPNIGWIDFAPTGPYPGNPQTPAHYDASTGDVTGWAKVLSLGDGGWLKMSDTSNGNWMGKGMQADAAGNFSGFAWNGNSDNSGMGWLSFNCSDIPNSCNGGTNSGEQCKAPADCPGGSCVSTCSFSNYVVYANLPPATPVMGTVATSSCIGGAMPATVNWTDMSNNETGFQVQYEPSGGSWGNFCSQTPSPPVSLTGDSMSCAGGVLLNPSTTYYFQVKATGTSTDSLWAGPANITTSYCPPYLNGNPTYNCDAVNLSWTQTGTGVNYYQVYRNQDNTTWQKIADNIPSATLNYSDTNITSGANYQYYIVAQTNGLQSNTISVNACPKLPTWKEVKTQ